MKGTHNDEELTLKQLELINSVSMEALSEMNKKDEGPLINFLFILILKVCKVSHSLKILYPLVSKDRTIEFSIGVLLRTILMDAMLFIKIQTAFENNKELNFEELKKSLEEVAIFIYAEDVNLLIKDMKRIKQNKDETEMKQFFTSLTAPYSDYFEWQDNDVKFKTNGASNNLKKIFDQADTHPFVGKETLLMLYVHYSKYDHVSSFFLSFEHQELKELIIKINASIIHMRLHLQLVLGFAYDFGLTLKNCLGLYNKISDTILD